MRALRPAQLIRFHAGDKGPVAATLEGAGQRAQTMYLPVIRSIGTRILMCSLKRQLDVGLPLGWLRGLDPYAMNPLVGIALYTVLSHVKSLYKEAGCVD
ncbi:hypothetical protein NDU88_006188 [Pleurodeles waltl]|uniref:Uncharacterized protein n=1 Tax=Pleurodeles waltl TaxID=8319 RepID=A0AAV7VQ30_PLEWA|nr:hypothetical protein NDU88_006188 [Pleurodeles waltl]